MNSLSVIKDIVKYELKYYFKSGVFWLITVALLIFIYVEIVPYVLYYPIETESDLANLKKAGAFSDFLVEKNDSDRRNDIKKFMVEILKSESISLENKRLIEGILPDIDNKSIAQIEEYFKNSKDYIKYIKTVVTAKRDATLEEAKEMVNRALDNNAFSFYFSRRYADRVSVFFNFVILFVFAFIFARDKKENMNEIIYSKPMKSIEYVYGKYLGAFIPILILLAIITASLDFFLYYKCTNLGLKFDVFDIIKYSFIWTLISILYSSSLITTLSIILKNGIAVIPIYIFYFIVMIRPDVLKDGTYGYPVDFFHFIIRGSEAFFDPENINKGLLIVYNRYLYTLLFIALLVVATLLWKNSRSFNKGGKLRENVFKRAFKSN